MALHPMFADGVWARGVENLRDEVASLGMNFKVLSERSGVDRRMIGTILSGDRFGSITTHRAIANALGRDPGLFFPRNELELTRAESLRTLDDRDRTVGQLRAQARALADAADTIEGLVAP